MPQREQKSGDSEAPFSIPEARVQAAHAANAGRQGEGEATSSPPVRKKVAGEEKRDWSSPLVQWLCSPAETKKRGSRGSIEERGEEQRGIDIGTKEIIRKEKNGNTRGIQPRWSGAQIQRAD